MPNLSHRRLFFHQFRDDFFHTGAVLPSSRTLGQATAAFLSRKQGPVAVLEAGSGTGAFTREITPLLEPGDSLDLVEINTRLIAYLKQRLEQEADFQAPPGVNVNLINADLRSLGPGRQYDYIIFSLPLTNFPPALVQELLELVVARLKPGGVFSYVQYVFIGRLKYWFGGKAARRQLKANKAIIQRFAAQYQITQRIVWINAPPAWVFFWRKPASN